MVLKTSGIITKDASVSIGPGLPNTTSKYFLPFYSRTWTNLIFLGPKANVGSKVTKKKTVNNNTMRSAPSIPRNQSQARSPGPPSGPAPSRQPSNRPKIDLSKMRQNSQQRREVRQVDTSVLSVPRGEQIIFQVLGSGF